MGDGTRPKNSRSYAIERYPELKTKLELEKQAQKQITVPVIGYDQIEALGVGMYLGRKK